MPLERMAEKSADNLVNGIEASKQIPFERVLFALGIRFVGETVAKKLAKHYKSIHALSQASIIDLVTVLSIGNTFPTLLNPSPLYPGGGDLPKRLEIASSTSQNGLSYTFPFLLSRVFFFGDWPLAYDKASVPDSSSSSWSSFLAHRL